MTNRLPLISWNGTSPSYPCAARAGFRKLWKPGPWSWNDVILELTIGGEVVSVPRFVQHLLSLPVPVIDWVNVFDWPQFYSAEHHGPTPPHWFCIEGRERMRRLVTELFTAMLAAGLSHYAIDRISHITDFEDFTAYKIDGASFGTQPTHAATAMYLFTAILREVGFDTRGPAVFANYASSHGAVIRPLGGGHNRATPFPIIGAGDGKTTFLSGYSTAVGDDGHLTEAELLAALRNWPAEVPLILAIGDNQPGKLNVIAAARVAGARFCMVWSDGVPDPESDALAAKVAGWGVN